MNNRPYGIRNEEDYNRLVKRVNELTKGEGRYWTVIWSKEYNSWWMTTMSDFSNKLFDSM